MPELPDANGLVRRVDWRFLTGTAAPRRVLSTATGELREAVESVALEVVDRAAAGSCDLAVLRALAASDVRRAFTALAPGGALYAESPWPLRRGSRAPDRALRDAGFTDVAVYWPWPPPNRSNPLFWLPLDSEAAAWWFLRRRPPAAGRLRLAVMRIARAAWWVLWRSRLLSPLCITARKPGAGGGGPGEPLAAVVERDLAAIGSNGATSSVSCVLLTGGRSAANKVVALAFAGNEPMPRMAVKLARVPEAEPPLRREAIILRELSAEGVQAIPRVLAEHDLGGRIAVCESVVAGRPLAETLRPATHPRLASRVTSLLADLATGRPRLTAEWWTWIAEPSLDALEDGERARALELLRRIGDLPEVPEHRDCSPRNVIVQADGALALVDWESSEPSGLPGLDLAYFLSFATFFVDRTIDTGRELVSYAAMLDPRTVSGRIYRDSAAEYSRRVGVTPDQLDRLRLLCWLVHARAAQVRGDASAAGMPREPLFLALARSELSRHG